MKSRAPRDLDIDDLLPLTPTVYEILVSVIDAPLHGYAILQAVNEAGAIRELLPGTLYRALSRLVDTGLLDETEAPDDEVRSDARRRYYALTSLGREVLAAEARRLARHVEMARARGLLADGEVGR